MWTEDDLTYADAAASERGEEQIQAMKRSLGLLAGLAALASGAKPPELSLKRTSPVDLAFSLPVDARLLSHGLGMVR